MHAERSRAEVHEVDSLQIGVADFFLSSVLQTVRPFQRRRGRIPDVNVPLLTEALKLPAPERIELAEALWDSVQRDTDTFPVPQAHLAILEERLRDMEANPGDESTWEEVRDRLQKLD